MSNIKDFVIEDGRLLKYNGEDNEVIIPDGISVIGDDAFFMNDSITKITIPEGVTTIGTGAFHGCKNLQEINLPKSIRIIGVGAFDGCENLSEIRLPEGIRTIDYGAFHGCKKLSEITLPDSLEVIEREAFSGCSNLKNIKIPDNVSEIGEWAFLFCSGITSINIPEGICRIENKTFFCCENLKSIILPSTLKSIGSEAFSGCENLEDITLPAGLEKIWSNAFSACKNLKKVIIPDSVKEIWFQALQGIDNADILIMHKVKINKEAFFGVNRIFAPEISLSLYSTFEEKLAAIKGFLSDNCLFNNTDIADEYKAYIKRQRKKILSEIFKKDIAELLSYFAENGFIDIKNFESEYLTPSTNAKAVNCISFLLNWKNKNFSPEDIEKHNKAELKKELSKDPYNVADMKKLWQYEVLPDDTIVITKYIGSEKEVFVPERIGKKTVTVIGKNAFRSSKITSVSVPSCVLRIEDYAFKDCAKLTRITIPENITLGLSVFNGCKKLQDSQGFVIIRGVLYDYFGKDSDVAIPDGVTTVSCSVFFNNKTLTSVNVPDSVLCIEVNAFGDCKNLERVHLPESIKVEAGAFKGCKRLQDSRGFVIINNVLYDYFGKESDITLPDGITRISSGTFANCTGLKKIILPISLEAIGSRAFSNCENLKKIIMNKDISEIGREAFYHCKNLKDEEGFVIINNILFGYYGTESDICIPEHITEIDNFAFSGYEKLKHLTVPGTVKRIGFMSFCKCLNLERVDIEEGLTEIGDCAFEFNKKLTFISIPTSVTSIGERTFYDCPELTIKAPPDSFTAIYAKKNKIKTEE